MKKLESNLLSILPCDPFPSTFFHNFFCQNIGGKFKRMQKANSCEEFSRKNHHRFGFIQIQVLAFKISQCFTLVDIYQGIGSFSV